MKLITLYRYERGVRYDAPWEGEKIIEELGRIDEDIGLDLCVLENTGFQQRTVVIQSEVEKDVRDAAEKFESWVRNSEYAIKLSPV